MENLDGFSPYWTKRMGTLEDIINPLNLNDAYKRVVRNGGSGGVDRMTVDELLPYLKLYHFILGCP